MPSVGRLRTGVSMGQRFEEGVGEAERVGDVVTCGVHGEGRLRTMQRLNARWRGGVLVRGIETGANVIYVCAKWHV